MNRRSRKPNYFRRISRHARTTDADVRKATLGTHIRSARAQNPSGEKLPFENARKKKSGRTGIVDQVMPRTTTRESLGAYSRRTTQKTLEKAERGKRKRRIVFIVVAAAVVAFVAVAFIASATFMASVSSRMQLEDGNARAALVSAKEGEPEYTLVVGEFSEAGRPYEGPALLMLLRMDASANDPAKQISIMNIPGNTRVVFEGRQYERIADAQLRGGDAELITAISEFAGVPVSHLAKIDNARFVQLVDELGGVEVEIPEEVDDPLAGSEYLAPGSSRLTGREALTFVRAKNFKRGVEQRMSDQSAVVVSLAERLQKANLIERIFLLEMLADTVKTDLGSQDIFSHVEAFGKADLSSMEIGQVPGYEGVDELVGIPYFYYYSDKWESVAEIMRTGGSFEESESHEVVDPASFTITVRNGSGLSGGAQKISDILTAQGYRVDETGNADNYVYDETLVIYKDEAHFPAAQALVDLLGVGRTVESLGFYAFETDILVVFGKDWKPLN